MSLWEELPAKRARAVDIARVLPEDGRGTAVWVPSDALTYHVEYDNGRAVCEHRIEEFILERPKAYHVVKMERPIAQPPMRQDEGMPGELNPPEPPYWTTKERIPKDDHVKIGDPVTDQTIIDVLEQIADFYLNESRCFDWALAVAVGERTIARVCERGNQFVVRTRTAEEYGAVVNHTTALAEAAKDHDNRHAPGRRPGWRELDDPTYERQTHTDMPPSVQSESDRLRGVSAPPDQPLGVPDLSATPDLSESWTAYADAMKKAIPKFFDFGDDDGPPPSAVAALQIQSAKARADAIKQQLCKSAPPESPKARAHELPRSRDVTDVTPSNTPDFSHLLEQPGAGEKSHTVEFKNGSTFEVEEMSMDGLDAVEHAVRGSGISRGKTTYEGNFSLSGEGAKKLREHLEQMDD